MPYEFLAKNGLISQGNITATGSLAVTQNISASATGSFGIVGIGTTNPATKFVVATSGTGQLRIGDLGFTSNYAGISLNAGSSYNLLSSPTDSTLYINRPSGGNINFRENNSDQIVLLSGGNVGIGSSSPSSKLEVLTSAVGLANQPNIIGNFRGDTDGRSLIRVDNTSTSAGAAALQSGVSFVAYSNTSNQPSANKHEAQIILGSTGATSVSGGQTGTLQIVAPLDIAFNVSASNTIMTGSSYTTFGSNAMYLARSGKVGIGTTTPVAIVDIQGTNITTYGGSNTGSLGTIYLSGNDAYNSGTAGSGIYFRGKFDAAGTTRTTFGAISAIKENNTDGAFDGALTFFARSGSNAGIIPERMRISSVGNVGIGTNSPTQKLDVAGSAYAYNYFTLLTAATYGPSDNSAAMQVFGSTGSGGLTNTIKFVTGGSERWRITDAGILQSPAGQTIQTSTGNLTLATGGGDGNILLSPNGIGKVGIGTTVPTAFVDIQGANVLSFGGSNTGSLGTIFLAGTDEYNSGTAGAGIYFRGKFNSAGATRTTFGAISGIKENNTDGDFSGALTFFARSGSNTGIIHERMRIGSSGNVGIGTTNPTARLHVSGSTIITGSLNVSANITCLSLTETSTEAVKYNILPLPSQLDNVLKLKPVSFNYKANDKHSIGLIAEEVAKIYPEFTSDNNDSISYGKITSVLIQSIKELKTIIDNQQKQIEDLSNKLK